ncbi:hypothetical protein SK128_013926 [Halocaridina rubra]|uniref:WAP domain-containing protein n=1 Tax=Halocaridina rubra TaxID=373956 RepID=A0AAN8XGK7_HALRR
MSYQKRYLDCKGKWKGVFVQMKHFILWMVCLALVVADDEPSSNDTQGRTEKSDSKPSTRFLGVAPVGGFGSSGFTSSFGGIGPGFSSGFSFNPGFGGGFSSNIGFGVNPGLINVVAPPSACRYWCRTPQGQAYCCEDVSQPQSFAGVVKPGFCPPVRPVCPPVRSFLPPATCSNDGACGGVDKCCFDTCLQEHVCKPPLGIGK